MHCLAATERFLRQRGVAGRVLFAGVSGSGAYGVQRARSDVDYVGVYAAPAPLLLGLGASLPKDPLASLPGDTVDVTLYEVAQFAALLAQGNPFCVEALFTVRDCYRSTEWEALFELRAHVLTRRLVDKYVEYARHALDRHTKRAKPGKRTYHIVRLLYEARRVLAGEEPAVFVTDDAERATLVAIREETISQDELQVTVEALLRHVKKSSLDALVSSSPFTKLNRWVVHVREQELRINADWGGA